MVVRFRVSGTQLRVFFHDRCFDGATTAALFGHYYRKTQDSAATIDYWGMAHTDGDPFAEVPWDADVNACVDFRYCADPRMHWWFDHHQSAFQPSSLREHYEKRRSPTYFFDPTARSCALYAYRVMSEQLGFELEDSAGHWKELLSWADRIDGAVFDTAREVVELAHPAFHLMVWLRNNKDPEAMAKTIESMGRMSMEELVALPWIASGLPALLEANLASVELIRKRCQVTGPVVHYDLADDKPTAHSGFAAYMLEPECIYSVSISHSDSGTAISVGCNPWAAEIGSKNIAEICERYGGGGNPNVGGISLGPDALERGREIVREVIAELAGEVD